LEIKKIAENYKDEIIALRRKLHQYPELSYQESRTAGVIKEYLINLGLFVEDNVGSGGIVAVLEGVSEGPNIGIRADMDALPIGELNEVDYRSNISNSMHACGHDGHMAIVLGTAAIIKELQSSIKGKVTFIFQPAEEHLPQGGAKGMIEARPRYFKELSAILGIHIWPYFESGKIMISEKTMMAAGDVFCIKLLGSGGHGAAPHEATDLVGLTGALINSLNGLTRRMTDVFNPTVISIGQIEGGKGTNIIPSEITLRGTTRYLNPKLKEVLPKEIERVLRSLTEAYNAEYLFEYFYGYPALKNDEKITAYLRECAKEIIGEENILEFNKPSMASEDFAVYLENIPGCYFWLGTYNSSKEIIYPLHHPKFNIDEEILPIGSAIIARTTIELLDKLGGEFF